MILGEGFEQFPYQNYCVRLQENEWFGIRAGNFSPNTAHEINPLNSVNNQSQLRI